MAEAKVEITSFPSGAAMLDVWRAGRLFVLAYFPGEGFGVDEVLDGEGFEMGYRHFFQDFDRAANQLMAMVNTVQAA